MYDKKFRLIRITKDDYNSLPHSRRHFYGNMSGRLCYLGFFKIGERGWFLCENGDEFDPVHRIHTSVVKDVKYEENGNIIVTTENTVYTFEVEE